MEKIGRRTLELRVVEDKGSQIGEMEETNLTGPELSQLEDSLGGGPQKKVK